MAEEQVPAKGMGKVAAANGAGGDNVVPLKQKASRAMRSRRRMGAQDGGDDPGDESINLEGSNASKRARVDPNEQVKALFGAQPLVFDAMQKKCVFKMVNAIKDSQQKTTTDALWKRYMSLNERESLRKGTNEPLVSSKEELIQILEALEQDNLVMYAAEDN